MKLTTAVLLLLVLGAGLQAGYKIGHHAGQHAAWTKARTWASYEAARLTDEQVKGYRHVQALREKSEYRRGWTACLEQF